MTTKLLGILMICALPSCTGDAGPAGPPGEDGADGVNGADGADGADGVQGAQGPRGPAGADGEDGADGADGERGPAGADGSDGADGADGSDADATAIIESFFCTGALEGTAGLGFNYNAILLSSGDLMATGAVTSAVGQSSTTRFYAPEQAGYRTAQVELAYDVDATADGGWFTITLDRATLVTTIAYREMGSTSTPDATWTMQPAACVHNFYNQ